jgi:hypothetical protein
MSELAGKRVQFKTLEYRRSQGQVKEHWENHEGRIRAIRGSAVIIEGEKGALYNRPLNEIAILEVG